MISQEYLDTLDLQRNEQPLFTYSVEADFLSCLEYGWLKLQKYYGANDWMARWMLFAISTTAHAFLSHLTNTLFEAVIEEAKELHRAKNAGYSGNNEDPWINFRECEKFGIRAIDGVMTRLCDKYVRFNNVYRNNELDQVGESAIDTLRDLAAYSLIAHVMLGERKSSVRSNHI